MITSCKKVISCICEQRKRKVKGNTQIEVLAKAIRIFYFHKTITEEILINKEEPNEDKDNQNTVVCEVIVREGTK